MRIKQTLINLEGLRTHQDKWLLDAVNYRPTDEEMISTMLDLYDYCGLKSPKVHIADSTYSAREILKTLGPNVLSVEKGIDNILDDVFKRLSNLIEYRISMDMVENIYNDSTIYSALSTLRYHADIANPYFSASVLLDEGNTLVERVESRCFYTRQMGSEFIEMAYYDYLQTAVNPFPEYAEFFELYNRFAQNIFTVIILKGECIVVRKPEVLIISDNNGLHNLDGPAAKFIDGYTKYFVFNREVPEELFLKLLTQQYTFQDFMAEPNEEIKSLVMVYYESKFGDEFVFRFLSDHLKKKDTYVDKKTDEYMVGTTKGMNIGVYTLFKGTVNRIRVAYVRCYCPSTDRMFFLGVDPRMKTAKDAIASLYTIPHMLVNEIVEIRRQGERFSTVLTPKGKRLIKDIDSWDLRDLVSISGDEYFSKITYEY